MTEPAPEPTPPPVVTSRLWKFAVLTRNSAYMPALVEAAARSAGKTYTPDVLAHVAAQPVVLDAITLTVQAGVSSSVDVELERLITDPTTGPQVDDVILAAVRAYTPPAA